MVDGAAGVEARVKDDFYPSTPECTAVLLPHIKDFPHRVWEPACGDGAISEVLHGAGYSVFSSDKIDRGYGDIHDFLYSENRPFKAIITNPPYGNGLAEKFIRKAFELGCTHVAMLLKADFWNSRRNGLFEQYPPDQILALDWRPDFLGKGRPFLNVSWSIWRPGTVETRFTRAHRP
jgi:hypothetical protein